MVFGLKYLYEAEIKFLIFISTLEWSNCPLANAEGPGYIRLCW
jgi:hypothetical protein